MTSRNARTVKGITHEQRYQLCLKKQACPTMKQTELAAWFKETYSFAISQPTISHSLKKSAEILALGPSAPGIEPNGVRKRRVRHPELELAIYQWFKRQLQEHGQNLNEKYMSGTAGIGPISGPILIAQAKKIAQEMNINDTVFCPGWLARFKARYGIKSYRSSHNADYVHIHHDQQQHLTARPEPPSIITDSITISNSHSASSCSPSPITSSPPSSPTENAHTSDSSLRTGLEDRALLEVRPSIAVPATINSTHTSLQLHHQQQPQDIFSPVPAPSPSNNDEPMEGVVTRDSVAIANRQVHDDQSQHRHQHQRDTHMLQAYPRQPHQRPNPHHTIASLQSSSTSPSCSSAALHLDILQSIPIANSPSESTFRQQHPGLTSDALARPPPSISSSASSLPSSPLPHSHGYNHGHVSLSASNDSYQEGYRLVLQLRQYVNSHLQEPTRALAALEILKSELELTRTRESITISETGEIDAQ